MSRPTKATVEYFPHHCKHGRVIFVLESKWGNNGYAAFYKLYEILGDTEGHAYNCNREGAWDYLVALFKIPEQDCQEILSKLCDLGVLDKDLWLSSRVLWSDCFVEDLAEVYSRRKIGKPIKPDLCIQKPHSPGQSEDRNPQSKVEYSKVKENTFVGTDPEDQPRQKKSQKPLYNFEAHSWENLNGHMEIWGKAFPALDIKAQLNEMGSWLEANPKNKKTNYTRFIHNWLSRSQDRAKPIGSPRAITQPTQLIANAQKCHSQCKGNCRASWAEYKAKAGHQCHWCHKFQDHRAQLDLTEKGE